jgi:hypothetical protein
MKNFKTYMAAIFLVGAISVTVFAFADDDPKKQCNETTAKAQCDPMKSTASVTGPGSHHKETASTNCKEHESASCNSTAAEHARSEAGSTASAECPKVNECPKTTASAGKTTASTDKE